MNVDELPSPNLLQLPVRVERATGAELVTRYFFKVSPRSLERWPVTWQYLNGKAHCETRELFHVAESMVAAAPILRGCRRLREPAA
jgi:hypothetical protein